MLYQHDLFSNTATAAFARSRKKTSYLRDGAYNILITVLGTVRMLQYLKH